MYSCGIYESKWHVRRLRRNFINIRYLAEVLCRMFPFFPLGENTEIVNQSHKVGGLPSTTCKTFLPGKFIPTHCIRRQLFFDSFRYYNCTSPSPTSGPKCGHHHNILREDELATYPQGGWARGLFIVLSSTLVLVTTYPQGGWARYISSGRMSSRTIRCSSTTMVLVTTYPQGGWARYISSGRMSSRTIYGPLHYHGACHLISSGRMSSLHILSEDELWSNSLFFYYYGGCLGRSLGYS